MNRLVIRHGIAKEKLVSRRLDAGIFAGPLLTGSGFRDAMILGEKLGSENPGVQGIAVSETLRAIQTAIAIGSSDADIEAYPLLNEVHANIPDEELAEMLAEGRVPDEALAAGEAIVADPPVEPIWISHGLTIAGLTAVVRMREGLSLDGYNLLPSNLEVRRFNI